MRSPITALVDTNVIRWMTQSTRHMVKKSIVFDGHEHTFNVPVVSARKLPADWRAGEIELLSGLVDYVKQSKLVLFRSLELMQEQLQAVQIGRGLPKDLLRDVDFLQAKAPIERGRFVSLPADKYIRTDARVRFCATLLNAFKNGGLEQIATAVPLSEFEWVSVHSFHRYAELCSAIHEKHYPDAWHLWTAERNGLNYFLTMDTSFVKVMTQTAKVDLPVKLVLPSELLGRLRKEDLDRGRT